MDLHAEYIKDGHRECLGQVSCKGTISERSQDVTSRSVTVCMTVIWLYNNVEVQAGGRLPHP